MLCPLQFSSGVLCHIHWLLLLRMGTEFAGEMGGDLSEKAVSPQHGSDSDCLCGDGWECMGQNNKHCVGLGGLSEQVLSIGTGLWHQNRIRIWIWGYCALPSTCRPPGQKATEGEGKKEQERQSCFSGCIPVYILWANRMGEEPSFLLENLSPTSRYG